MKKTSKKELALTIERVRALTGHDLTAAAGGGDTLQRTWCLPCGGLSGSGCVRCTQ